MPTESLVIVLVEDDDGHAHLVQRNLKRAGMANEIIRLRDGHEALSFVYREGEYASRPASGQLLLMLDINMPRVDGVEVLQRIKAVPSTAKIPVIMLTTTDDPREVARCYEAGCSVYISKPVEYEAFVEAVRRLGLLLQIVQIPTEQPPFVNVEVNRECTTSNPNR